MMNDRDHKGLIYNMNFILAKEYQEKMGGEKGSSYGGKAKKRIPKWYLKQE